MGPDGRIKKCGLLSLLLLLLMAVSQYGSAVMVTANTTEDGQRFQIIRYGNEMVKPAILNGSRYILVNNGWWIYPSPIACYAADENWNRGAQLGSNSTPFCDFYAFTFPSVWNDRIVVCGHAPSNFTSYIGFFNTTDYTWHISETANNTCKYITQVVYIQSRNLFVIMPYGLEWNNYIMTSTPEDLFTPANWVQHNITDLSMLECEKMFTYNINDGYGYIIQWNMTNYISRLIKWNMTDDTMTYPLNSTQSGSIWALRCYISSNSTTLFFSMSDNSYKYRYYYSNDGITFTNFLNLSMIDGGEETHAHIIPLGNQLLIGNIRDGNYSSYYAIYQSDGTLMSTFPNVRSHYTENQALSDGNKLIIGGEGGNLPYADLHIIVMGYKPPVGGIIVGINEYGILAPYLTGLGLVIVILSLYLRKRVN